MTRIVLTIGLTLFWNSWGNSYIKFVLLKIKPRFTSDRWNLYWSSALFHYGISVIVCLTKALFGLFNQKSRRHLQIVSEVFPIHCKISVTFAFIWISSALTDVDNVKLDLSPHCICFLNFQSSIKCRQSHLVSLRLYYLH